MNPEDLIAPGLSAIGGLFSSFFSNHSVNKQIEAQRQENALNRQFNAEESQKVRDFSLQMFNNENQYNNPKNVIKRLQEAGVNPALAFGGFADSASGEISSPAGSQGSITPSSVDASGIRSAGNAFMQGEVMAAQARLADAQAREIEEGLPYVARLKSLDAQARELGIDLGRFDLNVMRPKEAEKLTNVIEEVKTNVDLLRKQGQLTDQQIREKTSDANIRAIEEQWAPFFKSKEYDYLKAQIRKENAAADFSNAQAIRVFALLSYEQALMSSATANNTAHAREANADAYSKEMANSVTKQMFDDFGIDKAAENLYHSVKSVIHLNEVQADELSRGNSIKVFGLALDAIKQIWSVGTAVMR